MEREEDFENVPCKKCGAPMFGGWVENPIFRGKNEGSLEMFVGYCSKCNNVITKILEGTYTNE